MEGFFALIWMIFIIVTLSNAVTGKNKKNQKKTSMPPITAQPVKPQTRPATVRELEEMYQAELAAAKAKATQTVLPPQPAEKPAPIAPRVHTHLSLDCDQDDPTGSMDFISTEGVDPCHDDELPGRTASRPSFPVVQETPGIALEWSGDALVKSFIMQEVLTRPSQRRR